MIIRWERDHNILTVGGQTFRVTNEVRNELNGRRTLHVKSEVVRAVVDGQWGPPYMPRQFPIGTWRVIDIIDTNAEEFAPIKITTDAHQLVDVWALDAGGGYDHKTGEHVDDSGYHLHWSAGSRTTLGCGRVGGDTDEEIRRMASLLRGIKQLGSEIILEVIS